MDFANHANDKPVTNPLVTITIAAYKSRPDYLANAIRSALAQSWHNIEVIVSDDSPDPSLGELVAQFGDSRLVYRHNSPKLGVARNHWKLFREANGEFLAILNHDDEMDPEFISRLITHLVADPNLVLSFCDHWLIDSQGKRSADRTVRNSSFWGRDRLQEGPIVPFFNIFVAQSIPIAMGTVFRRTDLPANLPEDAGPAYDLWLSYLLVKEGRGAFYIPDRLSSWREHAENLTGQGGIDWSSGAAECWAAASQDPNLVSVWPQTRRKTASEYFNCSVRAYKAGHRMPGFGFALRSMRACPTLKALVACSMVFIPGSLLRYCLTARERN